MRHLPDLHREHRKDGRSVIVVTTTLTGSILTPDGWCRGRIVFDARIRTVEGQPAEPAPPYLLPGFVDLHVHGGGGADVMEGEAAVRRVAAFHARHGTTSLLATTVTAPPEELEAAFRGIARAMASPEEGVARIRGVHLEGPFISPQALGAQPPHTLPPDPDLVRRLAAIAPIRVATVAPETDPDDRLLAAFTEFGTRLQIGHTRCSYARARAALAAGYAGFTHLFNAMSSCAHRDPGAAAAALAHAEWAEIIPDLAHVDPGMILVARRAVPGLYGVTDAVAAAGMPDGPYRLGTHRIEKRGGTVRLADGRLAGSVLTMDRALRNLVAIGLPLDEAARRLSTLPAAYLGLADAGRLAPELAADLVELDGDLRLRAVHVAGHRVVPATDGG